MTSTEKLRENIIKYVETADDDALRRMQMLIDDSNVVNWWDDISVVREMDARYEALVSGKDPGCSLEELRAEIEQKKNAKG